MLCRDIGVDCPEGTALRCGESCGENSCTGQCCNCQDVHPEAVPEPESLTPDQAFCRQFPLSCNNDEVPLCGQDSLCLRIDIHPNDNMCRDIGVHCPDGTALECTGSCSDNSCQGQCCHCAIRENPDAEFCRQFPFSCNPQGIPLCGQDSLCLRIDIHPSDNMCRDITVHCPFGTKLSCSGSCSDNSCQGQCCNCSLSGGQPLANGQKCTASDQCESGLCYGGICVACNVASDCADGQACINRKCVAAPVCGNGIRELRESCDDGNLVNGDGCSQNCRRENGQECSANPDCESRRCLNGVCQPCTLNDQCDSRRCVDGACADLCGNGKVDPGEECDQGRGNNDYMSDRCRTDCRNPSCGDGVADRNEQCDDGNRVGGDGCDRFCRIEVRTVTIDLPLTPLTASAIAQRHPPAGKTGPGAIAVMTAGAAAGWAWMRKKRKTP